MKESDYNINSNNLDDSLYSVYTCMGVFRWMLGLVSQLIVYVNYHGFFELVPFLGHLVWWIPNRNLFEDVIFLSDILGFACYTF